MLEDLSSEQRLLLLKFLCAFAWTDLEVTDNERAFITRLVNRLDLGAEDRAQVDEWMHLAPSPASVDPALVPLEHRRTFLEAVRALIYSDGSVDEEERAQFDKLRQALIR